VVDVAEAVAVEELGQQGVVGHAPLHELDPVRDVAPEAAAEVVQGDDAHPAAVEQFPDEVGADETGGAGDQGGGGAVLMRCSG
jgi:hypothetical protein